MDPTNAQINDEDDALVPLPIRWKTDIQPMLDDGLFDEVDLYFQSYIERNPHESISLCLYGYFLHFQREYEKAEIVFNKCLTIDPLNIICLNYYTDLLSAQKRWSDAFKIAEKAYQLNPDRPWSIGSYCNIIRHLKDVEKVKQICHYALTLEHLSDPDTWMTLADCCWDLKLHQLAVQIFQCALERNPNDFELRDAFSELCIEIKQLDTAAQQLTLLAKENPENYTVATDLGYVLREIGKIEAAKFQYERALQINPRYPGAHNNIGYLLLHNIGDFDKAHHHLLMAIKYDTRFANPYRHLGDLYRIDAFSKHNFNASKMFYLKSLEFRKDYKESVYGLQIVYLLEKTNLIQTQSERAEINTLQVDAQKLEKYQSVFENVDVVQAASCSAE